VLLETLIPGPRKPLPASGGIMDDFNLNE